MLERPCKNLLNCLDEMSPELDEKVGRIPSVMTKPGIIPEFDHTASSPRAIDQRLIIAANQLPLKSFKDDEGICKKWRFEFDEDALCLQLKDGLNPKIDVVYVGCLKVEILDVKEQEEVSQFLLENFKCLPVFLSPEIQNSFYHGFCKHYLWPLFHYKLPITSNHGAAYDQSYWRAYVSANMLFARKIIEVFRYRNGEDFVWVHDYHLMVVPTLLRRRVFRVKLGFFLHSPFPSSEIFRVIPVREEILRGLLNADLVGFQTFDYARHFLSCCSRMMGLDYRSKRGYLGVEYSGRTVSIKILPVGVHMGQLQSLMSLDETAKRIKELKERFEGKKVIVGVDDMDVLKGISFKFMAMGHLLNSQPKLRGQLVLVQIANPARSRGNDVQEVVNETHQIAKEVNDMYGTPGYDPIVFIHDSVSTLEKVAYYAISDCCLLNAVRDGMNLVPYKYTVSRQGSPALDAALGVDSSVPKESVIIVSEFVGCSPSLSGAIRVNPWNVEEVAEAMHLAINLTKKEKQLRHEKHYKYISSHDIAYWAKSFDQDLVRACGDPFSMRCWGVGFGLNFRLIALPPDFRKLTVDHIKATYANSNSRLILLDYDGTMIPQTSVNMAPTPEVLSLLNSLCNDPKNAVFIVSGRSRETLSKWFSACEKLGISAEHGYFTRWSQHSEWESSVLGTNFEWKKVVGPIMELYAEATDGSSIEYKESALVWHYLDSDHDFGECQSKELLDHLENVLANEPVVVKRGKHIVEVKPQGVSKGVVVEKLITTMNNMGKPKDFVLCIGDDCSDEDMFEGISHAATNPSLPLIPEVYACTVGQKPSMARYYLDDSFEVITLIEGLAGASAVQQPKAADASTVQQPEPTDASAVQQPEPTDARSAATRAC
ncbi:probable alpha,alpha-trehalose-phosphate synthase [UDP-forming] 8 [Chenopodium quinoa]|uniref:probable alpha,alpha-trehalose-phosphate synthase [UDP-forming] 8 n=1 Tax=Chenopodium quinoa TaxID=63459 RepID=UPI000B77E358|nr:probable alpha,alpha-trehalose-phosphate synthase [UDP-forming] 8 [Chenopodium quinoa]